MTEQTMTENAAENAAADAALKARLRTLWAFGDYPSVAREVIAPLGPRMVEATAIGPSDRVIDVAAGAGNAAIPAARAGAEVVASDLTPELLAAGRRQAEAEGLDLDWREEDAEQLPYDDGEFDVAVSVVGVMFAPHHQRAADELVRVVRPGGRIGVINWTPAGFIGEMFALMRPYAPAPPPGVQPPPRWGEADHVRTLLGDRVADVRGVRESLPVDRFGSGAEFRDFFKAAYGPTIAVYRALADDPARAGELDAALARLGDEALAGGRMEWEYLLLTARRV